MSKLDRRGFFPAVENQARELRKESTPAEKVLWAALRNRQLNGLKFRRQHPIGPFIADFYCPATRLVIEVDGGVHYTQEIEDSVRTERLNDFGYSVIRFKNEEILNHLDQVLADILQACSSQHE